MDIESIINTLISSQTMQSEKINQLERDLAKAFREIEKLRALALSSQEQK